MPRRERPSAYGFSAGDALAPLLRMVALLIVLGLIYGWAREPQSWRWLAGDAEGPLAAATPTEPANAEPSRKPAAEAVEPGPNDEDPTEAAAARKVFDALSDRTPLAKEEMPAYWRLMKWARTQSFTDLERRADRRLVYTKLWEQPHLYRGKLIRLRLHIRRIVDWEAPQNSAGVRRVYEAWGWTDESKSFPYVVVTSELPEGMKTGDDVGEEGLFVGYFLKTIAFTAFNKNRSSPLLVGRLMRVKSAHAPRAPVAWRGDFLAVAAGAALLVVAVAAVWARLRRRRSAAIPAAPAATHTELENWFQTGSTSVPPDSTPPD